MASGGLEILAGKQRPFLFHQAPEPFHRMNIEKIRATRSGHRKYYYRRVRPARLTNPFEDRTRDYGNSRQEMPCNST